MNDIVSIRKIASVLLALISGTGLGSETTAAVKDFCLAGNTLILAVTQVPVAAPVQLPIAPQNLDRQPDSARLRFAIIAYYGDSSGVLGCDFSGVS